MTPTTPDAGPQRAVEFYRLSWEMVVQRSLHMFCNADPLYFDNVTQTVPNSQIPDEHWETRSKETGNPWQQYNALRAWADADEKFVRNVRLERQVSEPQWIAFDPPAAGGDGA